MLRRLRSSNTCTSMPAQIARCCCCCCVDPNPNPDPNPDASFGLLIQMASTCPGLDRTCIGSGRGWSSAAAAYAAASCQQTTESLLATHSSAWPVSASCPDERGRGSLVPAAGWSGGSGEDVWKAVAGLGGAQGLPAEGLPHRPVVGLGDPRSLSRLPMALPTTSAALARPMLPSPQ